MTLGQRDLEGSCPFPRLELIDGVGFKDVPGNQATKADGCCSGRLQINFDRVGDFGKMQQFLLTSRGR